MKTKSKRRLTREQWLSRALEVLEDHGESRLRLDTLTGMMGVTKGSFYWHFKNRKDFVVSLAKYWADRYTTGVVDPIARMDGTAEERLFELMTRIDEGGWTRYDLAIRAWASHEPEVLEVVRRVDRFRLDLLRSLFQEVGFEGRELEVRVEMFVVFHSLERAFSQRPGSLERKERRRLRLELLMEAGD